MKYLLTLMTLMLFVTVSAQDVMRSSSNSGIIPPVFPDRPESIIKWEETFDTQTAPADWIIIDNDGSGTVWEFRQNVSFTSGDTVWPHAGQSFWFSNFSNANGSGLIDEWIISPQLPVIANGDSLIFYAGAIGGSFDDSLKVFVSTTDQNPASFTEIAYFRVEGPTGSWYEYAFDLSAYAGSQVYVAVDYYIVDGGPTGTHSDNVWVDHFMLVGSDPIPVELTSLSANVTGTGIALNWTTATETNNRGFEVQRKSLDGEFQAVGFVEGAGTSTETNTYTFVDDKVVAGDYEYRLKQVDFDGRFSYSDAVEVNFIVADFELQQNYPNPFNPTTNIRFGLAADSKVMLTVYNVLGQEVTTLVNDVLPAGYHDVKFNAMDLHSGVYFARLQATQLDGAQFIEVMKMVLNK
jgi:hypothetical protein